VDDIAVPILAYPHASGVDDDDGLTLVSVPNPVPIAGHFNQALMGHFCQAPKK